MYALIRSLLFRLDPEASHRLTIKLLKFAYPSARALRLARRAKQLPVRGLGLEFKNPLGAAAGIDKNGECIDALFALGFGFVEVGGVTPKPQLGNPQPRLHRLVSNEAIINRLGFSNNGVMALVERLKQRTVPGILGVNIAKGNDTPLDLAHQDYQFCMEQLYPHVDYQVINISCPNVGDKQGLQQTEYLAKLFEQLKATQSRLAVQYKKFVPLLVKISPDLTPTQLEQQVTVILQAKMEGIVAVNTTLDHSAVQSSLNPAMQGGLSGRPLFQKACQMIRLIREQVGPDYFLIGVGGIASAADAEQMLAAGANVMQLYTALVYQGPKLITEILTNHSRCRAARDL